MNFYKHYLGDYARDTGHLSMLEHGAYRLMLDAFYATGDPLPADEARVFRMLRVTSPEEQAAVRFVLSEFWEEADGGGWINNRALGEIDSQRAAAETARRNGHRGGRPKTRRAVEQKPSGNPSGSETATEAEPNPKANHSQNPESPPGVPPEGAAPRGARIPEDWQPSDEDRAHARSKGLSDAEIAATAEAFRDYWTAESGQKARKRDWSAAWRTWIRRDLEGARRGRPGRPIGEVPHKPSSATLSDFERGYRAGVFGREREEGAGADWQRGYAKGVEEAERSRSEPAGADAAPCRREAAPRGAGPAPRVEIPDEVKAQLPAPPRAPTKPAAAGQGAPRSADSPVAQGVEAVKTDSRADGQESESVADLMEIPPFLRRAPALS